ncbi:MAG TPA: outer membrane beta-barrel protein [Candidatus Acidoferrales bacterium]|nr:outer membrane beta-barrel protein [Candidatus Acidoferrales bacterium]
MHRPSKAILAMLAAGITLTGFAPEVSGQQRGWSSPQPRIAAAPENAPAAARDARPLPAEPSGLTEHERYLLARIEQLEQRLAGLEARAAAASPQPSAPADAAPAGAVPSSPTPPQGTQATGVATEFFREATLNFMLDGYYGYNFNRPVGRINLLHAYDVFSNSFSLNQAAVVFERAPNAATGKRLGIRLDLQYGQATETLQGSAANEPRPQVYRPVFQAYGTYVAPLGRGLAVDFGKWASALGIENNYTKDQLNYSRSYFYNFLPFYHFGFRANYDAGPIGFGYWLVNGTNQSEDFNGFKSQAVLLTLKPRASLSWNINYYTGQEGRDTALALNPGLPTLPTQPGLSAQPISPAPRGRLHIVDTYATWNATSRLTLAGELDYVVSRVQPSSPPAHVTGGAAYARYRLASKFALAGRAEYLSDRGGLFSGTTQTLKETTLTADYNVAEGFLVRTEWRRDFSNRAFFLTSTAGALKREQNTATVGLIWWFGGKQGAW